ncbi:MAG: molybdopterin molybdotransferase MoeA [Rhodobacteraceae bacterium]|nr:molybdopterin molybdotransferase MoeA [Paracoccaceae bacterium]
MISVEEALSHVFDLVSPLEAETVPLIDAAGRILAEAVEARRDQPPFPSSAMDGYAVIGSEVKPGAQFTVIGEAAAGHAFNGRISPREAVRIFTGAPVPEGADRIVIQEDVLREGDTITLREDLDQSSYVRPAGGDFRAGTRIEAPRRLSASDVALLASMNIPEVAVARRPVIALIATGDELVMPGETPGPDQIIASNAFGLKALFEAEGAQVRMLPIARDTTASLKTAFDLAEGADLVVTIGGASVGDHDLVAAAAAEIGMERSFYKIAMRPGKPLMAGRLGDAAMIGLPGNPVSSMVCGTLFILPAIRAMQGLAPKAMLRRQARLARALEPNGKREHYMRAWLDGDRITAYDRQDSSLISVLSSANALMIRPIGDPARAEGDLIEFIPLP